MRVRTNTVLKALNRAEPGQVDRKVRLLDRRHGDGNGGPSRRGFLRVLGLGRGLETIVTLPAENRPAIATAETSKTQRIVRDFVMLGPVRQKEQE